MATTVNSLNTLRRFTPAHRIGNTPGGRTGHRHGALAAHGVHRRGQNSEAEAALRQDVETPVVAEAVEAAPALTVEQYGAAYQTGFQRTVRFLRSRGANEDAAEEIAQAAWSRGWERIHQLRTPEALEVWIASIAKHMFSAHAIKVQRSEEIEETTAACGPSATNILWNEIVSCCQPEEKKLLSLHYVSGYSSSEIAEKLGCSALAVRLRLMRVRRKIDANLPAAALPLAA
ncbi:MAG: RNA polymerase sigma factor [Bryobacterales bacterium]|nr:RNA polymerase sigma factor [Bryobacterales bacterium]